MIEKKEITKKYWRTTMIMILISGAIMFAFWYFLFGLEQFWIPSTLIVLAIVLFNYILMPRLEKIVNKLSSKNK